MQPKDFEQLANLERSIVKEQFQRAVKVPTLPFGPKIGEKRLVGKQKPTEKKVGKSNVPQVAALNAVTGDLKIPNPYKRKRIVGKKNHTEQKIRATQGKTAALVANDGLTPGQGGPLGLMNEHGAMWQPSGKPLYRPRRRTKTQVM